MNDLKQQLKDLSCDQLEDIIVYIRDLTIRKNLGELPSYLEFVGKERLVNEWMCYEEGEAYRMKWIHNNDDGDKKELWFDYIYHSSKHTHTQVYRIMYDDKWWSWGEGTNVGAHTRRDTLRLEDFIELFPDNLIETEKTGEYQLDEVMDIFYLVSGMNDNMMENESFEEYLKEECGFSATL